MLLSAMFVRNFVIVTTFAMLCLAPLSSAKEPGLTNPDQSTPTKLYFHAYDAQNDIPINTQMPDPAWDGRYHVGASTSSMCFSELQDLPDPLGTSAANKEYHTFFGYSSPSYVEYNFLTDGKPRIHPERGLSFDVEIDGTVEPVLHWYLSTQAVPALELPEDPNQAPLVVPNVVVRGTMRESDKISVGDAGYRTGEIIMQGHSEASQLAGPATQGPAIWTQVNDTNVYEIQVPLTLESNAIPRATGYNFQVEVFIENPRCTGEGDYIMPNVVDLHTSEGFRPRLELAIMNPVRIEYLHPQFIGDELVIHSALNSPWGNYDVDESSLYNGFDEAGITLTIRDSSGKSVGSSVERVAFVQRFHEHDHHQEAVDATYLWAYQADGAPDGVYTVELSVRNDQQSATALGVGQFEIGGDREIVGCGSDDIGQDGKSANGICKPEDHEVTSSNGRTVPGLAPILGAFAALAVAVVVRRRGD